MADNRKNLAIGTVAAGGAPSPATSGTSLTVTTGHGARFATGSFWATIGPAGVLPDPSNAEHMRCSVAGDVFTLTRAQKGSTARAIVAGDVIYQGLYAEDLVDELDLTTDWAGTSPVTPLSGVVLFSRLRGGRSLPAYVGPSGLDSSLQPGLFANAVMAWFAQPGGTGTTSFGLTTPTITGTQTARAIAATNFSTQMRRVATVSATTAAAIAELRGPSAASFLGASAGFGGFYLCVRFLNDTNASTNDRMFVGMAPVGAATNVDPSTLLNVLGVGFDAADSNFQMMCNDGAGACTKTDLGANFAKATLTNAYELRIFVPPNSTVVKWSMERLDTTGTLTEGTYLNTNQPATGTLLAPKMFKTNNATAAATALAYSSLYLEKDN